MGTSSSYGGPGKGGGLLPAYAPEPPEISDLEPGKDDRETPKDDAESPQPTQQDFIPIKPWTGTKASLTKYASSVSDGRPNRRHLRSATRGFVQSQGGAKRASIASVSGRYSASRLAGILNTISTQGAARASDRFNITQYIGKSPEMLLGALVDVLCPTGSSLEEAVARSAMVASLVELFEAYGVNEDGIAALEKLDSNAIGDVLEGFIAEYIYMRVIEVMASSLEQSKPVDAVISTEDNVRDYIREKVHLEKLSGVNLLEIAWDGNEGQEYIEQLFADAYSIIESG